MADEAISTAHIRGMRHVYMQHQAMSTAAPETVKEHLGLWIRLLDELINRRELEECGGWISVDQMLPDEYLHVLVWCEYGYAIAQMREGQWGATDGYSLWRVTAWQTMPTAPERET